MQVGLMIDLSESGPLELGQTLLLISSASVFLITSISGRKAGTPFLMVFAIVLGLGALREFDSEASVGLAAYLDTRAARWHFVVVMLLPLALVVIRNRSIGVFDHLKAVAPIVPIFILAMAMALGWLAATVEGLKGPSFGPRQLLMIEEVIELVAYAIMLAAAVWQVIRSGRLTEASSRF